MPKPFSTQSIPQSVMSKIGRALLILLSTAGLASAQVIISDNFDRNGGTLAGSNPDIGSEGGTNTWIVGSNGGGSISTSSAGGGSSNSIGGTDGSSTNGIINIPTAYLTGPNGSLKNGTYTLSLTMSTPQNAPGSGAAGIDFGLGHFANSSLDPWNAPANNINLGMGTINLLLPGGQTNANVFAGPVLEPTGISSPVGPLTQGAPVNFVLTFNVNDSLTAQWTMSATINGIPVDFGGSDTFTYVNGYNGNAPLFGDPASAFTNGAVDANQIFINEYGAGTGSFSQLVFAEAAPEPSTWALMLIGIAVLGFWARRKSASAQA